MESPETASANKGGRGVLEPLDGPVELPDAVVPPCNFVAKARRVERWHAARLTVAVFVSRVNTVEALGM